MKRTSLAVLMIALALVALAAPMAFAQAPAPKVTINGLIDNVTSYSQNIANYNGGFFNRKDSMWYYRTRGRFDIIGEVGKAKGVLGLELDHVFGQTGSNDSTIVNAGAASGTAVQTGFGTDGSFDLNTDSRGIIEVKWLYVEFPMPLIPVPTTARLGAQPFGALATYKLAAYATGDFAGVNIVSQITPNFKFVGTYVQVEENLVGTETRTGFATGRWLRPACSAPRPAAMTSPTSLLPRSRRSRAWTSSRCSRCSTPRAPRTAAPVPAAAASTPPPRTPRPATFAAASTSTATRSGLDSRLRMGPFSLDPTVMYQFGNKAVIAPATFAASGAVPGRKYYPDMNAWLVDVRAGFQLGPLLLEGLAAYSTGNSARNNTLGTVRYFQPLTTDTGYQADWGSSMTALGIDYLNAWNEAAGRIAYPGNQIGWDKYGRMQLGAKATYAITPDAQRHGWCERALERREDGSERYAGRGCRYHAGVHGSHAA